MIVLVPRTCNMITQSLLKYSQKLRDMGWINKYMDFTFLGTAISENPLRNMLNRERLVMALEYAMEKSIKRDEEIPFKVVEKLSPMVTDMGMGIIIESTFLRYLASALGWTPNEIFFMILATPKPDSLWSQEEIRAGARVFEDPEDGLFHCAMHPSQWNIAVFNKSQPEIFHAICDLETLVPPMYAKIEIERLSKEKEMQEYTEKMAKERLEKELLKYKREALPEALPEAEEISDDS